MNARKSKLKPIFIATGLIGLGSLTLLSATEAHALNFIWPVDCVTITSPFGKRGQTTHNGVDIACGGDVAIRAAEAGTVVAIGYDTGSCVFDPSYGSCRNCPNSAGNNIKIDHGSGYVTRYMHMKSMSVSKNQYVDCGTVIGKMGTTGCSTGQHLHFEYRINDTPYDPQQHIDKSNRTCTPACVPSDEVCDGKDNNCDGHVDENEVCSQNYEVKYQGTVYDPINSDINGDGIADVCARGAAGVYCALFNGSGYGSFNVKLGLSNEMGWKDPSNYATITFADVNGDGRADICARADVGIMCWPSTGDGFGDVINGPSMSDTDGYSDVKYYSTIRFADVTGDGKDDFCARFKDEFKCFPSTGNGFGSPFGLGDMGDGVGWGSEEYYSTIRVADINGDGKVDVCGRGSAGIRCWPSEGTRFGEAIWGPSWDNKNGWNNPQYYNTIRFPDINGDGMADLCARDSWGLSCLLSTGTGFDHGFRGPGFSDEHGWNDYDNYSTIRFADLNGDGMDDVCIRANAAMACYLSTGSGFGAGMEISDFSNDKGWNKPAQYRTIRLADINGDGKADVCGRSSRGIDCYPFTGSGFGAKLEGPDFSDNGGWAHPEYYSTVRLGGLVLKPCQRQDEVCDGIDNNCNGTVDEDNVCCIPETEICDGKDNNCNGRIDEDDVCCTREVCDGIDNDCDDEIDEDNVCCVPEEEICDGYDNDCDGQIDENSVCCVKEVCDGLDNDCDGDVDEDDVCCEGGKCCSPEPEICDGKDNDCDGFVDEENACCVPKDEICDGLDNDCDGEVDEAGVCCRTEICDGLDNDCDGDVDEDDVCCEDSECCDPETEICDYYCEGIELEDGTCCKPSYEVCDGLDNDCDSEIDEDNVCCRTEICDGKDNDCDGEIDEDDVCCTGSDCCDPAFEECDQSCDGILMAGGVCCYPLKEICDGEDNDCDGEIDEECIHSPSDVHVLDVNFIESDCACTIARSARSTPSPLALLFSVLGVFAGLFLRRRKKSDQK